MKRNWMPPAFLALLVVGGFGYVGFQGLAAGYVLAHVGGLGIVGLVGTLAGTIAKRKGRGYWPAFFAGLVVPIFAGASASLLIQPISCGGSVLLGTALLVVIVLSLTRRVEIQEGFSP